MLPSIDIIVIHITKRIMMITRTKLLASMALTASFVLSGCAGIDSQPVQKTTEPQSEKKDVVLTDFDKELVQVEKKMIESSKRFTVDKIRILSKQKVDDKWSMYSFEIFITEVSSKRRMTTPMIIFTDGVYQTNSLMDLKSGVKLEIDEQKKLMARKNDKQKNAREEFEKQFVLDSKYYNKEHLIAGKIDAANKVVMISDPLCVACISAFPAIYDSVKNRNDIALFYYHFPLKNLHPTANIVVKAMEKAKQDGIKDVVAKTLKADFMKYYDVYQERDEEVALKVFNKILKTNYTLHDLKDVNVSNDMIIGSETQLSGTPTVLFNGSLYHSREKFINFIETHPNIDTPLHK